jgi:hypothetical protein
VHLLHHARLVFEAGRECEGMGIDVMHFTFSEMKIAMLDKKIPPYASYIMRLILDKGIEGDFEIEEDFLCDDMEVHKPNKLYRRLLICCLAPQVLSLLQVMCWVATAMLVVVGGRMRIHQVVEWVKR